MEAYATALSYAIPGFIILIFIEEFAGRLIGVRVNREMDTISSISSGITNVMKSILGLTLIIISYSWMVEHLAIFEIKSTLLIYILAFIGIDFAGYWAHRFEHVINIFWNRHIIHHSSEEFNLSCALRQPISTIVAVFFFLYIPMALLGIPAEVVALLAPLHLFAQFWYHTRLINKMGFLEYILVTPSHHRVHHAINPEYMDKNFGQIFIFWDRLFGTYQEEIAQKPPVYGIKRPAGTWNPISINFMHLWLLIKDAWRTKSWLDKIRIWWMPTGWRPADVKDKYPVYVIEDVYQQKKYDTNPGPALKIWAWAQLIVLLGLLYYMLLNIAQYQFTEILLYFSFIALSVAAFTTLMDKNWLALPLEIIKCLAGIYLLYMMGGWFGLDAVVPYASYTVFIYLVISLVAALLIIRKIQNSPIPIELARNTKY
jgi:alkylglycerol monooxygenase